MGQFSVTQRITAAHPNSVEGYWIALDPLATTITFTWENETLDVGSNGACLGRAFYSASPSGSGSVQIGSTSAPFGAFPGPTSQSYSTAGIPSGSYVAANFGPNTSGNTISMDVTYYDDLTYCVYGAQRRMGAPDVVSVTFDLALAVITYVKANLLTAVIGFLLGQVVNIPVLCSTVQPPYVQLTAQDFLDLYGLRSPQDTDNAKTKLARWFLWASWAYFCECTPGSPSPNPPPIIIDPNPPVPHDPGTSLFLCDNADLCTQLLKVNVALNAIVQRMIAVEGTVTLIQRQGVPFAYALGTVHSGLTADGDFAVADLLGIAVDITTLPSAYPSHGGDPDSYHQLGRINVGTIHGWERSWWVTHDPYLILPISGAITKVGYSFPSGIVATITELVREP